MVSLPKSFAPAVCFVLSCILAAPAPAQVSFRDARRKPAEEDRFKDIDKETGEFLSANLADTTAEARTHPDLPQPKVPLYRQYPPEQIVVGEIGREYVLTRRELERMVEARFGKIDLDVDDSFQSRHREKILRNSEDKILTRWAVAKTLVLKAQRSGLEVTPEEASARMDAINAELERAGSKQALVESTRIVGISQAGMLREVREGMLVDRYLEGEIGRAFPEERLREIYQKDPGRYAVPRSVHAWEIFKSVSPDMSAGEKKDVRKELYKIRKKAAKKKAKDFRKLASSESDKPSGPAMGGAMGWISALTAMDAGTLKAILGLKPGQVSKIVKSPAGYHIFTVSEVQEPRGTTFDAFVRERVMGDILAEYKARLGRNILRTAPFPVRLNPGGLRLIHQPPK